MKWLKLILGILLVPIFMTIAQASVREDTSDQLRAWGQKDLVNGRAHLWIQNESHTWWNVVNNPLGIGTATGYVHVGGFTPGMYRLELWDTYVGVPTQDIMLEIGEDGLLVFLVKDLVTDIAVQVYPAQAVNEPPLVVSFSPDGGVGQLQTYVDLTMVYSDTDGFDDIGLAFLFVDNGGDGLATFWDQSKGEFGIPLEGGCAPGEWKFLDSTFTFLDCRTSHAIGVGDTLTVTWTVGLKDCFEGGCGQMSAQGWVRDRFGAIDHRFVGNWWLQPWTAQ